MTQPVQEPTQGRTDSGQEWRTRQLFRRPATFTPAAPIWEAYTPDVILEAVGGGSAPTQPTIIFQYGLVLYPPGGVATVVEYSPIGAIFSVAMDDPGVVGSSGQAIYRVSMPTACPTAVDGSVVGTGLFYAVNPAATTDTIYYPMTMIVNDDGYLGLALPIPNTTVPGSGTRAGTNWAPQPDWPEDLNNPGLGLSAGFSGSFFYPAAAP
jgi:hypothetical protein